MTRVVINQAGIDELMRSSDVKADLLRRAKEVRARARATSPVGPDEGGHMRDTIDVFEHEAPDGRPELRIGPTKSYAPLICAYNPFLANALDAAS